MKPFIHKFKTKSNNYIYDVNTNQFIKVNSVVYDIIEDWNILTPQEIISKWREKYKVKEINSAIQQIQLFFYKGHFASHRPKKMWRPNFEEGLREVLNSNVNMLILNITEKCNLRCKYCVYSGTYYYERSHSNRSMGEKIIEKALNFYFNNELYNADIKCISFYGGEPLLEFEKIKNIGEYVSKNFKNKSSFSMTTNGTLLNEEIIKFLIKYSFFLLISLDGPSEIHDKYRVTADGKTTFGKIINNLRLIKKLSPEYYQSKVSFSVTIPPNVSPIKIDEFFENFDIVKEKDLQVSYIVPWDTEFFKIFGNYDSMYYKEIEELREKYIKNRINNKEPSSLQKALFEKILITIHKRNINVLRDIAPANGICIPGQRKVFVSIDGKFFPCERIGEFRNFNIGDIERGLDLQKVKNLIENYILNSEKECLSCWAVRLCDLCYVSTKRGDLMDFERKKEICINHKNFLNRMFITYATIMENNPNAFDFTKNVKIV
jgi:uncharacterized protein